MPFQKENKLCIGRIVSSITRKKIGDANRGRKLSEETKRKISLHNKKPFLGKHHSKKTKEILSKMRLGKIPWNKDKKNIYSDKVIKKMSDAKKGLSPSIKTRQKMSEAHKGKNGSNWKGGITLENCKIRSSIQYRLWRESVFARDSWTCQKTGQKGGLLRCHHIQNFAQFPELRFAIDNGITLSNRAHKEFHKKYGIKNNTKEQLEEFLNK